MIFTGMVVTRQSTDSKEHNAREGQTESGNQNTVTGNATETLSDKETVTNDSTVHVSSDSASSTPIVTRSSDVNTSD